MCGIAGIYNLANSNQQAADSKKIIKKMTDKLIHRGPDDEGYFIDGKIVLGHRRLAIIDLTAAGHQPMKRGDLVIVYNGEVYNYIELRAELLSKGHKFQTQTDTEVILAAYQEWGEKCLAKFNGMWAFAIYDQKKDLFFASRDRFGVKPFYYYQNQEIFLFASEIKAILAHYQTKTKPNDQLIYDYLISGTIEHTSETMFRNIFELQPGHYLTIKKDRVMIKKYWELKKVESNDITQKEAAEKFRELFADSINLRLRSDVPVGTCLSGGLDSSAIVCQVNQLLKEQGKIAQIGRWQKTFSAVYDKSPIDETKYINIVAAKTKAKKNFVFPGGKNLSKEIKKLIYHHDLPLTSSSVYAQWCVFRLASQNKIKVMLDGQGADETLAGYFTFFPIYLGSLWQEGEYGLFLKEFVSFIKLHGKQAFQKQFDRFFKFPIFKSLKKGVIPTLKDVYLGAYLDKNLFNTRWLNLFFREDVNKKAHTIQAQTLKLISTKGLKTLLRYEDRNSMAFSIESRTPFLDYRLAEFIFNLADSYKIKGGETKWIMRLALKGLVPAKILARQDKIGFETPEEPWLKNELYLSMKEIFNSEKFTNRPYFKAHNVQKSFEQYIKGEPINYQLFWRIYNLEIWLEQNFDSNPLPVGLKDI